MPDPAAAFPKLLVADPDRSVAFYEALGFVLFQRDNVFAQLRWAPGAEVVLVTTPAGRTLEGRRGVGVLLCFRADAVGVDTVAERARMLAAPIDGPADQPWHTREVVVTDPDGYRVNFLQSSWPLAEPAPSAEPGAA
jgi:catechol 2,3-dioxygenase-like lactoylglutathione lyase family enzyme